MKIKSDDEEYDKGGNVVEYNHLSGSAAALMIESAAAQGPMCGNVVATRVMVDGRLRRGPHRPVLTPRSRLWSRGHCR